MTLPLTEQDQVEAERPFVFMAGFYYAAMWFMAIPRPDSVFGQGGNVTVLVYRADAASQRWYVKFRFRHYHGPANDDPKDVLRWNLYVVDQQIQEQVMTRIDQWLSAMGLLTGQQPHRWEIGGDCQKFADTPKPFWLHQRTEGFVE